MRKKSRENFCCFAEKKGVWIFDVLPNIDVLGSFPSADDVVAPFDARGVVLVCRGGLLLLESETVQKSTEVQNLTASRQC